LTDQDLDIIAGKIASRLMSPRWMTLKQEVVYSNIGKAILNDKESVNSYLRHLKAFFKQAKEDKEILDMPKIKMIKDVKFHTLWMPTL